MGQKILEMRIIKDEYGTLLRKDKWGYYRNLELNEHQEVKDYWEYKLIKLIDWLPSIICWIRRGHDNYIYVEHPTQEVFDTEGECLTCGSLAKKQTFGSAYRLRKRQKQHEIINI